MGIQMVPLKRLLLAGAGTLTIAMTSVSANAETLAEVLKIAYDSNPTIAAERARLRATSESRAQAWADALPQITASGSFDEVSNDQTLDASIFNPDLPTPTPITNSVDLSTLSVQVQGELVLFNGLRNVNSIRQAASRVKVGGAQLASVEQDVLLQTATAYFDVVRDMAVYEANLNNVKVLVRQQEQVELRFDVGDVTRTDVAQSSARLAGARANLASAQAQLAVSRAQFKQFVGDAPGTLEEDPVLPTPPGGYEDTVTLARGIAPA
ncbi:MAG: TolC family protein, partial [Pseudomonadota bacterium]